jgi:type II secretory pathway pseudopilin PulG
VGHAVASLVIGIIGFFSFGIFLLGSLVGMTLGIVALKKEGSEPSVYGGKGIAIAGIVMNIAALCMIVPLGIIAAIAIPNLLASRKAANEASAIQSLRVIMAAESTYQATEGMGKFGAMNQLTTARLVDSRLSSGTKNGYVFTITPTGTDFEARATPLTRSSGNRSFYISSTGEIHVAAAGRPASAADPLLESFYGGSQYGSPYDSQYGSQPRPALSQPDFQDPATAPTY